MTEEDFIRSNGHINGGNDLPREFLSKLYHSICKNEIGTTPEQCAGFPEITQKYEEVYQTCIDGFLADAKIPACHHLEDALDDLMHV
ncbi:hypothetical protein WN944_020534 [Citrus x changshan-huyou]|uniref:SEC7 domain-containing protein n=1 Tax=Citrus x changshan-huyou TaxID=2935761 RepID=A0AAP0LXB3_9ROSI